MKKLNIIINGIGGQGIILASNILAEVLSSRGYDVKVSVIKGMSRRGGPVSCQIKAGKKIYSPLIQQKDADIVVCLDERNFDKYLRYLNEKTLIIVNGRSKKTNYERDNIERVDTDKIAEKIGNIRLSNLVLLGFLSGFLDIEDRIWMNIIKSMFKNRDIRKLNLKAFFKGKRELI